MKNGKLFSKFSLIDLGVILLILLVAVVAVVRLGWFSTPEEAEEQVQPVTYETVNCTVKVRFSVSSRLLGEPFTVGERMFIGSKELGTVQSIQRETATQRVVLQDGSVVTTERKDAYNYIVTLNAALTRKNGMLYLNKDPIVVGSGKTFSTHYFSGKGYVISVEKNQ